MQFEEMAELVLRVYIQTGPDYNTPGRASKDGLPHVAAVIRLLAQVVMLTDKGLQARGDIGSSLSPSFRVGFCKHRKCHEAFVNWRADCTV